eukprot:749711-Hanusia_phi.AAC.1
MATEGRCGVGVMFETPRDEVRANGEKRASDRQTERERHRGDGDRDKDRVTERVKGRVSDSDRDRPIRKQSDAKTRTKAFDSLKESCQEEARTSAASYKQVPFSSPPYLTLNVQEGDILYSIDDQRVKGQVQLALPAASWDNKVPRPEVAMPLRVTVVCAGTVVKVGFQREDRANPQAPRYKTFHVLLERRPVKLTALGEGPEAKARAPCEELKDDRYASKGEVVKLGNAVENLQVELREVKDLVISEQRELRNKLSKLEAMLAGTYAAALSPIAGPAVKGVLTLELMQG